MPKSSFEEVDFNADKLRQMSPSAEIFCDAFVNYLHANGWSEEEYEREFERRMNVSSSN